MNSQESPVCPDCGSSSINFDFDAGQSVCTSCGTTGLTSSLVLDSFTGYRENVFRTPRILHAFPDGVYRGAQSMVKGAEWHLQNHRKEHRALIHNLCAQLEFQGGARAIYLFELAMAKGEYRWGNDAKLVSAVSVAIAMTEEKKVDVVPRIARLVGETISTILRMWTQVLNTLDMQLYATSPLLVVEAIYTYLQEALEPPTLLPHTLLSILLARNISIERSVLIAEQLALFFSQSGDFAGLPAAATACAIFILAIEMEYGQALPVRNMNILATTLGERVGAGTVSTILDRRKVMIVLLSEWASLIPWIYIPPGVLWNHPRTSAVIHAVQDILWFQNELRELRRIEKPTRPSQRSLEGDETLEASEPGSAPLLASSSAWTTSRNRKRPRGAQQAQRIITRLLDPSSSKGPAVDRSADAEAIQERLSRIELQVLFGLSDPLSRLQALSLQRGGERNIEDDELFEPGELEGYQNPKDVARLLGDSHPEWDIPIAPDSINQGKKSKADAIPKEIQYSDDEESDSLTGLDYSDRDNDEGHADPEREAEEYSLGKEAYLAFGILADYEGTDLDTARYFGSNMEQE